MTLLEQIKKVPNKAQTDLLYLKHANLPLLLYGGGSYAEGLKSFLLDKYNIYIDHVVVDEQYYTPDILFAEKVVEKIDDVLDKYTKVNLIFAIHPYNNADKFTELSKKSKIANCFIFDIGCLDFEFPDYYEELTQHSAELEGFYARLADDHSRDLMAAFINAKISGNPEALVSLNSNDGEQYYPEFMQFADDEAFVDCGAFDGDTILSFIHKTQGKYAKIYAFEPDAYNLEKLKENISQFNNIEIIEKGCFSRDDKLYFQEGDGTGSTFSNTGNVCVEVDAIDNIVSGKISFIKMDIEGSELEALKGAQKTIISNTPRLAVSVYHKPEDLFTIPQYIQSLDNSYSFYLRHYGLFSFDLVLYAISNK